MNTIALYLLTDFWYFFSNSSHYILAISLTPFLGISIEITVSRRHDVSRCRGNVRHFLPFDLSDMDDGFAACDSEA